MSIPTNGTSKSSKTKLRKNSKDETNGKTGNDNGESLLAPINSYEQTKIESASKAYKDAKQSYTKRVENIKQQKTEFKQEYKQELIVYEKVKALKAEGLSGNISEEQSYVRLKDELAKFKAIEQSLQVYKQTTVNFLLQKKQKVLESVTDARRKGQVEINKQKKKRKAESSNPTSQETDPAKQQDPQEPQGSGVINQALLEKELERENQFKRAQLLIDHFVKNKTALERAHDQYEEYLNNANGPYESELYSFHIARVQKWIHIIGNRLHLYYKITTDEEEPEEFEQLHDGRYDLPYDGFETGKFDFYQKVKKDKPRIRKPKEYKQTDEHSQSSEETRKTPLNSKSNSLQSSRSTTLLSSVHSSESEPENMAKK